MPMQVQNVNKRKYIYMWLSYVFIVCTHKLRRERENVCTFWCNACQLEPTRARTILSFSPIDRVRRHDVFYITRESHIYDLHKTVNTTQLNMTWHTVRTAQYVASEKRRNEFNQNNTISFGWLELIYGPLTNHEFDWHQNWLTFFLMTGGDVVALMALEARQRCNVFANSVVSSAVVVSSICASIDCMWWSLVSSVFMYVR